MTKGYIFLTFIYFSSVLALSAQDFEVAPVLVDFTANPGETQTKTLTLRNHSPERQKFVLNLSDYNLGVEGEKEPAEAGTSSRTLFNWLNINPSFIELNPNESADIELIITVPRDGFQTRWGMIHVQVAREQSPSAADKQLATGVVLVPRIAVLIKQSPRANQNYSASVKNLREVTQKGDEFRSFDATISNTGEKVIDARVFLALANLETAEEEQFKPKTITVYPGYERNVNLVLPKKPVPGSYALAILMDYGHNTAIEGSQILLEVK